MNLLSSVRYSSFPFGDRLLVRQYDGQAVKYFLVCKQFVVRLDSGTAKRYAIQSANGRGVPLVWRYFVGDDVVREIERSEQRERN